MSDWILMKKMPETSSCLAPDKVKKLMDLYIDMSNSLLAWHCVDGKWTLKMKPVERVDGDEVVDAPTYSELKNMLPAEIAIDERRYMLSEIKCVDGRSRVRYYSESPKLKESGRDVIEYVLGDDSLDGIYIMIIHLALVIFERCLLNVDKVEENDNQ